MTSNASAHLDVGTWISNRTRKESASDQHLRSLVLTLYRKKEYSITCPLYYRACQTCVETDSLSAPLSPDSKAPRAKARNQRQ